MSRRVDLSRGGVVDSRKDENVTPAIAFETLIDTPDRTCPTTHVGQELPFEDLAATHAAYEARVFRFLLYSLRDRDDALTVTQDTFLTAWRTRTSFRGECSEATWLIRIAISLLRNHRRTSRFKFWQTRETLEAAELVSPIHDPKRTPEQAMATQQELAQVWRTVEQLSEKQKTVFLLRFIDELELPEIALATGQPLSTVKTHLYRALERVRQARKEAK